MSRFRQTTKYVQQDMDNGTCAVQTTKCAVALVVGWWKMKSFSYRQISMALMARPSTIKPPIEHGPVSPVWLGRCRLEPLVPLSGSGALVGNKLAYFRPTPIRYRTCFRHARHYGKHRVSTNTL
jgi:hypothetical protein